MFQQTETRKIKKALVAHFKHPFSVTRDKGTASHWISISWRDGATQEDIRRFCFKFNDSSRDDIQTDLWCGSQYTTENREHSLEAFLWATRQIEQEHNIKLKVTTQDSWRGNGEKTGYIKHEDDININDTHPFSASQLINQLMYKTDFRKITLKGE
ncbi:hypothetical protein KAT51_04800 [bacterium]|nr:hypothetical protein [bacterium]